MKEKQCDAQINCDWFTQFAWRVGFEDGYEEWVVAGAFYQVARRYESMCSDHGRLVEISQLSEVEIIR